MIDLLHPLSALTLAGIPYRRKGTHIVADCPSCSSDMYVLDQSLVCENPACTFSRGSAVDLLALTTGSYADAVELAAETEPFYRDRIAVEALEHSRRRKLVDFAIEAARLNHSTDKERIRARQAIAHACQTEDSPFMRGHWYLTTEQSDSLLLILAELGVDAPANLQGRPTAVAPYWASWHSIGSLFVVDMAMKVKSCLVEPVRSAWFGLQQMHPACGAVDIFPEYVRAMAQEKTYALHTADRFPTHLMVNPRAGARGMGFTDHVFHGDTTSWSLTLAAWSYAEGFDDAVFEDSKLGRLTLPELLESLLSHYEGSGRFMLFTALCAAMKLGPGARAHLLELSRTMANRKLGLKLEDMLTRKLLERDETGGVYETSNGYEVERGQLVKRVTNFTLRFDSITCFSNLSDLQYEGTVFIGQDKIRFELPGMRLESPGKMETALRGLQIAKAGSDRSAELITIHSVKEFKRVMEILRADTASLPRSIGIRNLGWTRRHDQFIMPVAIVDAQGVHGGVRYAADDAGDHSCYSSELPPPDVLGDMPVLDPWLAELMSTLAAQTIRHYHGLRVRLTPLQNNAVTRERGLALFCGFGQHDLLRLTNILPRNLDLNRGMPCLVGGINALQAAKIQMAGAWLSDKGLDLSRFSEDEISAAACTLPALIAELCKRLLGGGVAFRERRSVRPLSAMADEGAKMIQAELWHEWPSAGVSWVAIDNMLERREKEVPKLVRVDERQDSVIIPSPMWEGLDFDSSDLAIELGLLCDKIEVGTDSLRVDRNSMYRLLGEFYGDVPRLQPV